MEEQKGPNRYYPGVPTELIIINVTAFIVVGLRMYSRLGGQRRNIGLDDYFMVAGFVIGVVACCFGGYVGTQGAGKHIYDLPLQMTENVLFGIWMIEFWTLVGLLLVKISVALFLLRIGNLQRYLRVSLICLMGFLVLSTLAFIAILFAQCRPIEANWNVLMRLGGANCFSVRGLVDTSYANSVISVLTDFLCALLPFPILWNLQLERKTKVSMMIVMCLGCIAGICGIMRTYHVKDLYAAASDPTWSVVKLGEWAIAEQYVGIIAGSLPPCRVLFVKAYRHFSVNASSFGRSGALSKRGNGDGKASGVLSTEKSSNTNWVSLREVPEEDVESQAHSSHTSLSERGTDADAIERPGPAAQNGSPGSSRSGSKKMLSDIKPSWSQKERKRTREWMQPSQGSLSEEEPPKMEIVKTVQYSVQRGYA